jgi:hypothetical protein
MQSNAADLHALPINLDLFKIIGMTGFCPIQPRRGRKQAPASVPGASEISTVEW